jgi:hypothetical protein
MMPSPVAPETAGPELVRTKGSKTVLLEAGSHNVIEFLLQYSFRNPIKLYYIWIVIFYVVAIM